MPGKQYKLKNKINKKTGHFICTRCDCEVNLGRIIQRLVYCNHCADIIKGIRNENGILQRSTCIYKSIIDQKHKRDLTNGK